MAVRATTPTTNFQSGKGWYQGAYRSAWTQRVNATLGAVAVSLGFNIPANARVIEASIVNVIVPTVTGTAAAVTADSIALMMYPVSNGAITAPLTAAPTTVTVKGLTAAAPLVTQPVSSSGTILAQTPGIGTSETNGRYRGVPLIERVCTNLLKAENPYPVAALLQLVPSALSSNTVQVNGTAITSGFCFGTGTTTGTTVVATVDCVLYVETNDDYPSMP